MRKVPASASMSASTWLRVSILRVHTAMTTAIITTFRLCNTVAVAEFECSIAARYVYWHSSSPNRAKASSHSVSVRLRKTPKSFVPDLGAATASSTRPESSMRTAVTQLASRP